MIKVLNGAADFEIEAHETEWSYGWDEAVYPVRIPADSEAEAREMAHRAGGHVYVREIFVTAWADAPA